MILDRKKFEILKGKDFFKKHKNPIMVIDYFLLDEEMILKELLKFTDNFCVLLTPPEQLDVVNVRCFCDQYNVKTVLNSFFYNAVLPIEFKTIGNQENMHSIICVKDDIKKLNKYSDFLEKSLNFSYMLTQLKNYYFDSFELHNKTCIVRLNTKKDLRESQANLHSNDDIKILSMFGGIGDHFMLFSYMIEFINKQKTKGKEVFLPIVVGDSKADYFASNFYSQERRLNFSTEKMYEFCLFENSSQKVLPMFNVYWSRIQDGKYKNNLFHFTEVIKEILNIDKSISPYHHRKILENAIFNTLGAEEKQMIDMAMSNKKYIGVQFFTGQLDYDDIWITDNKRNWDQDKVERFLEMCSNEGYELITFSDCPYEMKTVDRILGLSISGYAYAISKLEISVGIDSSQGHIAAFWGVPSITLWGEQTPENFYGAKINFQPLRCNKSIYTHSRNISDIQPEFVVSMMKEVISHTNTECDCYEGNEIIICEAEKLL